MYKKPVKRTLSQESTPANRPSVLGNQQLLREMSGGDSGILQRYVTIGTGGGKRVYRAEDVDQNFKNRIAAEFNTQRHNAYKTQMRELLETWLSDDQDHAARTYGELAEALYQSVYPTPVVMAPDSIPVHEGGYPVFGTFDYIDRLTEIAETMAKWIKGARPFAEMAAGMETTEAITAFLQAFQHANVTMVNLLGYIQKQLDQCKAREEGGLPDILPDVLPDLVGMDQLNVADSIGNAFDSRRGDVPIDFTYQGEGYHIRNNGDSISGHTIGDNFSYSALCSAATAAIKTKTGNNDTMQCNQILAGEIARTLLDTSFVSEYMQVRGMCAIFSSAEAKRSSHNLIAVAMEAWNYSRMEKPGIDFNAYMEGKVTFWRPGGARLSRERNGPEVSMLAFLKQSEDLEEIFKRLLDVRQAKLKIETG